ncbi:MAG TPA: maleylpyruvate isomerase family mycothiol-dependent enzyme [Pseudonocardiaceae bacterium]|jgi:uncharacterized protein (TIGR03083 family)
MSLARDERSDLADFLRTLSPRQWEAQSLCAGWRVRDVVAHVISYDELDRRALVRRFAKGLLRPGGPNAVGLREYGMRSPDELLALLRAHLEPTGLPAAFGGSVALVDGLIHHQDIRRPLGMPRAIPAERILPVLRHTLTSPRLLGFWRVRGLRLAASDLDWSVGRGPEVRGPAEALLMAIAGRRGVAGELTGPGVVTLARRIEGP